MSKFKFVLPIAISILLITFGVIYTIYTNWNTGTRETSYVVDSELASQVLEEMGVKSRYAELSLSGISKQNKAVGITKYDEHGKLLMQSGVSVEQNSFVWSLYIDDTYLNDSSLTPNQKDEVINSFILSSFLTSTTSEEARSDALLSDKELVEKYLQNKKIFLTINNI